MIRQIELFNRKISYRIKGSGPTLVLLHGFLMSSATWGVFFDKLSSSYRIIAPDFPGHGNSEFAPPSNSMDFMAEVTSVILKEENINSCLMLGHSMGGYVALAMLERFPEKISKLLLLNSYPFADTPEKIDIRTRATEVIKKGKKDLFLNLALKELFPQGDSKPFNSIYSATLEAISHHPVESLCATIEGMKSRPDRSFLLQNPLIPVKWILSIDDNQLNAEEFLHLAEKLNLVLPEIIEGGHMSFVENPDLVISCVKNFM